MSEQHIYTNLVAKTDLPPELIEMNPSGSEITKKPGIQKKYYKLLAGLPVWLVVVSFLLLCVTAMVALTMTRNRNVQGD